MRKGLGEAAWLEEKSHFYTDQQAGGGQLYTRDRYKKTTNSSEHSKENGREVVMTHGLLMCFIIQDEKLVLRTETQGR